MPPGMAVYVNDHAPGDAADLHTHDEDHVLVMRRTDALDGRRPRARSRPRRCHPRPCGHRHGVEVVGDEPVELLCIESPNPEADRLEGSPADGEER